MGTTRAILIPRAYRLNFNPWRAAGAQIRRLSRELLSPSGAESARGIFKASPTPPPVCTPAFANCKLHDFQDKEGGGGVEEFFTI